MVELSRQFPDCLAKMEDQFMHRAMQLAKPSRATAFVILFRERGGCMGLTLLGEDSSSYQMACCVPSPFVNIPLLNAPFLPSHLHSSL